MAPSYDHLLARRVPCPGLPVTGVRAHPCSACECTAALCAHVARVHPCNHAAHGCAGARRCRARTRSIYLRASPCQPAVAHGRGAGGRRQARCSARRAPPCRWLAPVTTALQCFRPAAVLSACHPALLVQPTITAKQEARLRLCARRAKKGCYARASCARAASAARRRAAPCAISMRQQRHKLRPSTRAPGAAAPRRAVRAPARARLTRCA